MRTGRRDGGFVLVTVLWAVVLIAGLLALFVRVVGMHAQAGSAFERNAVAEAAADGAIRLIAFRLAHDLPGTEGYAIPRNGAAYACSLPGGVEARVAVQDQDGLIDLNHAPLPLLEALVRTSVGLRAATALLAVIAGRRSIVAGALLSTPASVEGRPTSAGAFRHPDELLGILDEHGEAETLLPYLTVHSQSEGIDPAAAPDGLLAVLRRGKRGDLPADMVRASRSRVFSIIVDLGQPSRGRSVRRAVVELLRRPDQPYAVREWSSLGRPIAADAAEPAVGGRTLKPISAC